MVTLGAILIALIVLAIWRKKHQEKVRLQFVYSLYHLRDDLRRAAIKGEVDKNSWLFEYYDNTFSKMIKESYYITLMRVILGIIKNEDNEEWKMQRRELESQISQNIYYSNIQTKYTKIVKNYIIEQHKVSLISIIAPIIYLIISPAVLMKKINYWIRRVSFYPENSSMGYHTFS